MQWLEGIKPTAEALFLVGDVFDFWFEYNRVVPKGFVRTLAKLAELADSGKFERFYQDYMSACADELEKI